jgi:von Willebrand factor type A domain/PEP-CTERM motif
MKLRKGEQFMRKLSILLTIFLFFSAGAAFAASTADVIFVVDESGSMSTEHTWISSMVTSLDNGLIAAGVTSNQYALVGFGNSAVQPRTVAGFGTAAQLAAATGSLVVNGGTEDGWAGINYALSNFSFRAGAAINVVLITDEDRDNTVYYNGTYNDILAALTRKGALLNAVVDNAFGSDSGAALGRFGDTRDLDDQTSGIQNAILEDGNGGYTLATGATTGSGFGTTATDYVDLALATGGAAWNLNTLRSGGLHADSFTKAFVNFKVQEIKIQPGTTVPEPGTMMLLVTGLAGIAWIGRRKKN